jgi:hypothetical protein
MSDEILVIKPGTGKTSCALLEIAMHLSGKYPVSWRGRRFSRTSLIGLDFGYPKTEELPNG